MAEESLQNNFFDTEYLKADLKGRSVRGGVVTMATQGVQFFLQMGSTVVLARLLTPQDYGLIAMVTVVVGFAQMFKDAGLSMATVQKDRITPELISTLFWINVLISAFLGVCVLAASPLVAMFYGRPELTTVTMVLSISFIISGLTIQHRALLRRHLMFGALATIQIISQVIALGVTIALAFIGWRYWALVVGSISTALFGILLTFFFCPWIPGRMKKRTGVRDMLKFGGCVTGSNFTQYLSGNIDNIMIGRLIGVGALGLYAKAYRFYMMPVRQLRGPITRVAMPMLSALKEQPERYVKYYQRLVDIIASLTVPLAVYCAVEAEFLILTILGPQWLGAVTVFRIMAIGGLIIPSSGTVGVVMLSHGFSGRLLKLGIFSDTATILAILAGLPYGLEGVAAARVIKQFVFMIPILIYSFKKTPVSVSMFLKTITSPFLLSLLAMVGGISLRSIIIGEDSIAGHLLFFAFFVCVYSGLSCCRKSTRDTIRIIGKELCPRISQVIGDRRIGI